MTSPRRTSQDTVSFPSEGIVLAVFSAFAYAYAYAYERGYAMAFGIPADLIDLRWVTFFGAAVAVFVFGSVMLGFPFVAALFRRKYPKYHRLTTVLLLVTTFVVITSFLIGLKRWRILVLIAGIVALEAFLAESFTGPVTTSLEPLSVTSRLGQWLFRRPWILIGPPLMVLALPVAFVDGFIEAVDRQYFLMTQGPPPLAIARAYGDKLIAVQYDSTVKALVPIYRILPVTDSGRVFRSVRLPASVPVCRPPSTVGPAIDPKMLRRFLGDDVAAFEERCERYRLRQR